MAVGFVEHVRNDAKDDDGNSADYAGEALREFLSNREGIPYVAQVHRGDDAKIISSADGGVQDDDHRKPAITGGQRRLNDFQVS